MKISGNFVNFHPLKRTNIEPLQSVPSPVGLPWSTAAPKWAAGPKTSVLNIVPKYLIMFHLNSV